MSKIEWSTPGSALYESGVDQCVLYVNGGIGVPWNGIVSIEEKPEGGDPQPFYLDGFKYMNLASKTEYAATLNAFYSPVEFDVCDGAGSIVQGLRAMNQRRMPFGLTYRTLINNGDGGVSGYKIHIVYNCLAKPTVRNHATLSDDTEVGVLSWDISTRPVRVAGISPTAYFQLNSLETDPDTMALVESILYGSPDQDPHLPPIETIIDAYEAEYDGLIVIDHGDGTFTVSGRDDVVQYTGVGTYSVKSRYATLVSPEVEHLVSHP